MYNNLVKNLKDNLDITTPVDLEELISKFSDIIILFNEPNEYGDYAHSYIIDGVYTIKVKDSKVTDENKYYVAKEIGHILLNHLDNYKTVYDNQHNELDCEADEFARELLMPEDEFRKVVYENSENGVCDLVAVGKHFKVDTEIVLVKGRFIGLFAW